MLLAVYAGCGDGLAKDQRIVIGQFTRLWGTRFDLIDEMEDHNRKSSDVRALDRTRQIPLETGTVVVVLKSVKYGAEVIVVGGEHDSKTGFMLTKDLLPSP